MGKVVSTTEVVVDVVDRLQHPGIDVPAGTHTISIAFTNDLPAVGRAGPQPAHRQDHRRAGHMRLRHQPPSYFQAADWLWKPIAGQPRHSPTNSAIVGELSLRRPMRNRAADLYDYGVTLIPASAITSSTPRYDVTFTEPWGSDPFGFLHGAHSRRVPRSPARLRQVSSPILDPTTGKAFGHLASRATTAPPTPGRARLGRDDRPRWQRRRPVRLGDRDEASRATPESITAEEFSAAIAANTGIDHALFFSSDIAGARLCRSGHQVGRHQHRRGVARSDTRGLPNPARPVHRRRCHSRYHAGREGDCQDAADLRRLRRRSGWSANGVHIRGRFPVRPPTNPGSSVGGRRLRLGLLRHDRTSRGRSCGSSRAQPTPPIRRCCDTDVRRLR